MYDVEKKLKYLRKMQRGKIPEEYQQTGESKRYKTLYEKYNAMYDLLEKCDVEERNCIEITLLSRSWAWGDLKEYIGIVPVFLSSVAIIFSAISVFYDNLLDDKADIVVAEHMEWVVFFVCIIVVVAILMYYLLDCHPGRKRRKDMYILEILKKVNEKNNKK